MADTPKSIIFATNDKRLFMKTAADEREEPRRVFGIAQAGRPVYNASEGVRRQTRSRRPSEITGSIFWGRDHDTRIDESILDNRRGIPRRQ